MMHMKKLAQYTPEENNFGESVLFLKDEQGADWYETQKNFAKDTLKIAYNDAGVICSAYEDISRLWPINLSVTEIKTSKVPEDFAIDGNWIFDGNKIKKRIETKAEATKQADAKRAELISRATQVIAPLQDAVELTIATDDEAERLKAWKIYRIALTRVNTSNPSWPEVPQ
ncbi:tail fiber assembly protein [Ewingella sp. S1.OA.A_B6]